MHFDSATGSVSPRIATHDRVISVQRGATRLVVVVDGAGGIEGGEEAAELAITAITASRMIPTLTRQSTYWGSTLDLLDGHLLRDDRAGECAVAIAAIVGGTLVGASVGDCGAWMFTEAGDVHLTVQQRVKPLVGSGAANVVTYGPVRFDGTLVLGSDGLFKYAATDAIRRCCTRAGADADSIRDALIDLVRLPSGDFHDDMAIAVCRESGN